MVNGLFEGCLPQILLGPFLNTLTYFKTNHGRGMFTALPHKLQGGYLHCTLSSKRPEYCLIQTKQHGLIYHLHLKI